MGAWHAGHALTGTGSGVCGGPRRHGPILVARQRRLSQSRILDRSSPVSSLPRRRDRVGSVGVVRGAGRGAVGLDPMSCSCSSSSSCSRGHLTATQRRSLARGGARTGTKEGREEQESRLKGWRVICMTHYLCRFLPSSPPLPCARRHPCVPVSVETASGRCDCTHLLPPLPAAFRTT